MTTVTWRPAGWLFAAALSLPSAIAAQTLPPPTNVTLAAEGSAVLITWTSPEAKVTYRILRAPDPKSTGKDLTRPLNPGTVSFVDAGAGQGTAWFYQVVAVYPDGTEGASAPIQFPAASARSATDPSSPAQKGGQRHADDPAGRLGPSLRPRRPGAPRCWRRAAHADGP